MGIGRSVLLTLFSLRAFAGAAELRFSRSLSDGAVLQRGKPVTIRGFADKNAEVTVTFGSRSRKARADKDGEWAVVLDPMEANSRGRKLTASTRETRPVTLDDILVGDVILFARQTTIDVSLGRDEAGRKAAADLPSALFQSVLPEFFMVFRGGGDDYHVHAGAVLDGFKYYIQIIFQSHRSIPLPCGHH